MASSYLDQLKLTTRVIGQKNAEYVLKKVQESYPNIRKKSDQTLSEILYDVSNYVENCYNSDYIILDEKTIIDVQNLWVETISNYVLNYDSKNYIETNKILIDYRINGVGYYWVDLQTNYSIEMIARMNNCGRCNYGDNLIELREIDTNGTSYSHLVIVINNDEGVLYQIKGKETQIPDSRYSDQIFDLLMLDELTIKEYKPQFKPDKDFKLNGLNKHQLDQLKIKRPGLTPKSLI